MKELFTVKRRLTTGRRLYFINRRRVKKSDYERAWLAACRRHNAVSDLVGGVGRYTNPAIRMSSASASKVEQYDDFTGKWQTHSWLFLR